MMVRVCRRRFDDGGNVDLVWLARQQKPAREMAKHGRIGICQSL